MTIVGQNMFSYRLKQLIPTPVFFYYYGHAMLCSSNIHPPTWVGILYTLPKSREALASFVNFKYCYIPFIYKKMVLICGLWSWKRMTYPAMTPLTYRRKVLLTPICSSDVVTCQYLLRLVAHSLSPLESNCCNKGLYLNVLTLLGEIAVQILIRLDNYSSRIYSVFTCAYICYWNIIDYYLSKAVLILVLVHLYLIKINKTHSYQDILDHKHKNKLCY